MKKRILAILIALVMIVSMVPMTAMADECEHNYEIEPITVAMHQYKCTKCGDAYGAAQCKNKDGNDDGKCDLCENEYQHTCNEEGVKYKNSNSHNITCSVCGAVKGTTGHKYNGYVSEGENGHVKACACGDKKTSVSAHKDNNSDYRCDSCSYIMHDCDFDNGITPSSDNSSKEVKTHNINCICGNSVEANCRDNDGDRYCDACEYELYEEVPPHEHDYVAYSNNNGTHNLGCTCGGFVENMTCTDNDGDRFCDTCEYELYEEVPPHEHDYVAYSNNNGTHNMGCTCGGFVENMTCTDNDGDRFCDACEYELYEEVPPHEHNYVAYSNNNGTHNLGCTCGGLIENMTCLDSNGDGKCDSCDYQKYVHNCEGRAWTSNNDGTHTSKCTCGLIMDGPYDCYTINGRTCYMCGYDMHECFGENEIIANKDGLTHSIFCDTCSEFWKSEAHDWDDGVCTECGFETPLSTDPDHPGDEDAACSHSFGRPLMEFVRATCTEGAHWKFGKICQKCGQEYDVSKITFTAPAGHEIKEVDVPATCEEQGYKYDVCENCDYESEARDFVDAIGHVWNQTITAATCTEAGNEHYECENCEETYDVEIPAAGHDWEDGICTECGGEETDEPETECTFSQHDQMIELGCICPICKECGHTFVEGVCRYCGAEDVHECEHPSGVSIDQEIIEATCEEDGYILTTKVCNECGEEYEIESPLGKATGHNWSQTITEATCTEDGNEHYECANCDDFYDVEIPATGHKYVNGKCTCGASDSAAEVKPACNHPSGVSVGQTVVEPTCEAAGYILTTKVCNTCGKTYTVNSPLGGAIGHNWYQTITPATCTKAGKEHYECANCGDFYDVEIPKTLHVYVNGKCTCGATDPAIEVVPSAPSSNKIYTWDFLDVFLTEED